MGFGTAIYLPFSIELQALLQRAALSPVYPSPERGVKVTAAAAGSG